MNEAINTAQDLSDKNRNEYFLRILEFIQLQHNYLVKIPFKAEIPSDYNRLSDFQASAYQRVYKDARFTKGKSESNYTIDVVTPGEYLIKIEDQDKTSYQVYIDENSVRDNMIYLGEGIHMLDLVSQSDGDTALEDPNRIDNFSYSVEDNKEFEFKNFEKGAEYILEFDYKISGPIDPFFSVIQYDASGNEIELEFSPRFRLDVLNDRFYYFINPHILTEKMLVKFFAEGDKKGSVGIENFYFSKNNTPYVVLQRDNKGSILSEPKVEFRKIDPTKYIVKVSDANGPFILNFNQTYHPGWEISINSLAHFRLNSFSNAWFIDKKGTYEFELRYAPQRYVFIGGIITIATVIIITVIFLKKRHDK